MARQHLYSRIPARLSMFNKTDGFDTFARSEGLTLEYIEKEIAPVYDNKPTKNEAVLIRDGKLPPIYCQRSTKDGDLIQSCVSFIPKDYTGERSSYLVHSLVLSDEEKTAVTENTERSVFDPEMFIKDFSKLDIDGGGFPDDNYPEFKFEISRTADASELIHKYDSRSLKLMINAVLSMLYGKYRAVFPVLPVEYERLSEEAVSFMDAFLQIMPYHMRPLISFVTNAADTSKYNAFKVRFLPEKTEIQSGKGVGILFRQKAAVGMRDEEVSANLPLVEFFYSLFGNEPLRREFLLYVDRVVKSNPKFAAMNDKNVYNLVFLFRQCSGMYNENAVLPNDTRVEDFIAVYDKYRAALSDEYRVNALKCLQRYPEKHAEIPKKVFTKIVRFYQSEPDVTKRLIMNVALDLIHTDVMREKLFAFIKTAYPDETPEIRAMINNHLASVYYGGFLQGSIFTFFSENFANEPVETQDIIVEKLLLTVRTQSMQAQITEFFDRNYDILTENQKTGFYRTCLEMLPESDALAGRMIAVMNTKLPTETDEVRETVDKGLEKDVENDQKRKDPKLLPFILAREGYCTDLVIGKVFTVWGNTNKIFSEFMSVLLSKPISQLSAFLIKARTLVPDMSDETEARFKDGVIGYFEGLQKKFDLMDLLLSEELIETVSPKPNKKVRAFLGEFDEVCLKPRIIASLYDVFSLKHRKNGVQIITEYARTHPYVAASDEYRTVENYLKAVEAVKDCNPGQLLTAIDFPDDPQVRTNISQCLRGEYAEKNEPDVKQSIAIALLFSSFDYLSTGKYSFRTANEKLRGSFVLPEKGRDKAEFEMEKRIASAIISAANGVCKKADVIPQICSDESGVGDVVYDFSRKYQRSGVKWIESFVNSPQINGQLADFCMKKAAEAQGNKGGLFKKLFGKRSK